MRPRLSTVNLGLRGLMELGVVAGLAYWGYHIGASTPTKALFAVGAPILGFGFWGLVDFHQLGRWAEPVRLIQELLLSGLAAVALYVVGAHVLAVTLAVLSVVHHSLVYALGGRLLEH